MHYNSKQVNSQATESTTPDISSMSQYASHSSWVEIDQSALEHNIAIYRSIITSEKLAIVIKSNAYGHGIALVAKLFDHNNNVDYFCLGSLSEAVYLREIGISKPLLVVSILDVSLENALIHDIELVIYDMITALELNRLGEKHNKKAKVHIKVDTGMSRVGIPIQLSLEFIEAVHKLDFIIINGLFTHHAASDSADQAFTDQQLAKFNRLIADLALKNIAIPLKHSANTASTSANPSTHFNMVRIGIGTYGLWPSNDNKKLTQKNYPHFYLKPVLTWKTKILLVKEIPAGSYVSYGLTYQTNKITKIATIPVGYWDGYDRALSNKGQVLIKENLAPVIGRITMNLTMIDVTDIGVKIGDEVTLLGNHNGITSEDLAKHCDTINYEIVTRINPLITRILK